MIGFTPEFARGVVGPRETLAILASCVLGISSTVAVLAAILLRQIRRDERKA